MHRRGISAQEIAEQFDGGLTAIRGILDGSVVIDIRRARTLAEAVGGSQDFWLKRQANYEAALARAVSVAAEREAEDWIERVPALGVSPRGRPTAAQIHQELRRRLAFFNVANIRSWQTRYVETQFSTRFRESASFSSSDAAAALWLRRGEIEADLVCTKPWNSANLKDRLDSIRRLSQISQPARFLPKLKAICAESGVAVVLVKAPKGCHASGAIRPVAPDKAMMLLSFRYRADDQFWFTVFHELGHLLLHGAKTFVDDDETTEDQYELEANQFASACIVPKNRLSEFQSLSADRDSVIRFSVSVGISPGLIVGQMQHHRMIEYNRLNSLKRRWTWDDIATVLN